MGNSPAYSVDPLLLLPPSARPILSAILCDREWVDAAEIRQPIVTARPAGVAAGEKWIDVDTDQQILIAYEGDAPVFITLVSTGINHSTPTGIYRIRLDVSGAGSSPKSGWTVKN